MLEFLKKKRPTKFQEEKKEETVPTQETAFWADSLILTMGGSFERYNPDMLATRKGYDIYRKMLRDDQVKAVYNLLVNIIISRQIVFAPADDSEEQQEIIDFFKYNITTAIKGTWLSALRAVLLGKAHGFSISEKNWKLDTIDGKEYWVVDSIKPKPYESFTYDIDDFGNIKALYQDTNGVRKKLDPDKFIIYVANPELDPIWGESDLRAAYRPYWEKDIIGKFHNIYLERLAGGFLAVTPDKDAPVLTPQERADLKSVIGNVQKMTGALFPRGYKPEVVMSESTAEFESAIAGKNRAIAKSLLVPNLLGLSEDGKFGSRALGDIQFETFMMVVKEQGDYLAEIMNEQFFSQLALWNFGVKDFPRFRFEDFTIAQRREIAKAWGEAVASKVVVNTEEDEQHTRELLLYERRDMDAEVEDDEEGTGSTPEDQEEEENIEAPEESSKGQEIPTGSQEDMSIHVKNFAEDGADFDKRLDFAALETTFDTLEEVFFEDLSKSVDRIMGEITTAYAEEFKKLPKDKDKIDYTEIQEAIMKSVSAPAKAELKKNTQKNLKSAYDSGRSEAKGTLNDIVKTAPADIRQRVKLSSSLSKRLACKKQNWSVLNFIDGISLDSVVSYFESQAFFITGEIATDMLDAAARIFVNGARDDKSVDEMVAELEGLLPTLVGTPESKESRARLTTIARTNITTAFNQAQLAVYADPELGDFVEGMSYSAIVDSRTTSFCKAYHNRKFLLSDPVWSTITPPNHFNCRSVMIPITVLDEWTKSKAIKSVQPAAGFGV